MTTASVGKGVVNGIALYAPGGDNVYITFLLSILLLHIKNL